MHTDVAFKQERLDALFNPPLTGGMHVSRYLHAGKGFGAAQAERAGMPKPSIGETNAAERKSLTSRAIPLVCVLITLSSLRYPLCQVGDCLHDAAPSNEQADVTHGRSYCETRGEETGGWVAHSASWDDCLQGALQDRAS